MDYDIKSIPNKAKSKEEKSKEIKLRKSAFSVKAEDLLSELQQRMDEGKKQILSYAEDTGASFNNAKPNFEGNISDAEMYSVLKLVIEYTTGIKVPATHNGLGYNNLIFMSLLLAKMQINSDGDYMGSNSKVFATLAIEEPEAHLHPAMQYKFLKFLKGNKSKKKVRQIFVTTHSTHITSAVTLDEIICLHNENGNTTVGYPGKVFPTDKSKMYVQRFLDATKSDMLFAQKVILVEGLAEQLLLSIFAEYEEKSLEDNHIAIINVGGRYFEHFLHLFDQNNPHTINKKIVCLTDRDPESKLKTDKTYSKCYPFNYLQDTTLYDYKDNPTVNILAYSGHPNIQFFSQDAIKGKTFEYDLILCNPANKLLITESVSNQAELNELMDLYNNPIKTVTDFVDKLPKGTTANPNKKNIEIENGINSCNWTDNDDKKKAIIASRYLNSIGKGENALELSYVLTENLCKKGTVDYHEFNVPDYIKQAIDWICQ